MWGTEGARGLFDPARDDAPTIPTVERVSDREDRDGGAVGLWAPDPVAPEARPEEPGHPLAAPASGPLLLAS